MILQKLYKLQVSFSEQFISLSVCPMGQTVNHCNILQLFVSRVFECPVEGVLQSIMDPCDESCSVQFYTPEGVRVTEEACQDAGTYCLCIFHLFYIFITKLGFEVNDTSEMTGCNKRKLNFIRKIIWILP